MAQSLDAEFACVIYDEAKRRFYAARDPIGIRPLFMAMIQKAIYTLPAR